MKKAQRTPANSHKRRGYNPKLWRVIEGAVADAIQTHPNFVTKAGHQRMTQSITKRVIGNLQSAGLLVDSHEGRSRG